MKKNSISTKIKIIGILFTLLLLSIVTTTIYLNDKNHKDATIINIAGKQRMLSQNISKNIFYLNQNKTASKDELNSSIKEFIYNLNSLKGENSLKKIPTFQIENQLLKVEFLWNDFYKNIEQFKSLLQKNKEDIELKKIVDLIYSKNIKLLNEIDALVSLYTINSEKKVNFLKNTQYFFAILIIFLILYSFLELKNMEKNALKFIKESKKAMEQNFTNPLKSIEIEAENEFVDASNVLNNFLKKINSAIIDSNSALEQSKNASIKLEELTNEFDAIINELQNKSEISLQLNSRIAKFCLLHHVFSEFKESTTGDRVFI